MNPLIPFLDRQGVMILDGGLATELEARGASLDDRLWSARVLLDDPATVQAAHSSFLLAGADCIATATYQASVEGFEAAGFDAPPLFRLATDLAVGARDLFWSDPSNRRGRLRPLVAASLGPYGAYLADGSEYVGRYDVAEGVLARFHERRLGLAADGDADLVAWETVPSAEEARVLAELAGSAPDLPAWISFSCRDARHISDGTELRAIAREMDAGPFVAIGINCTAPGLMGPLVGEALAGTDKPILVYPNRGGRWDAEVKQWCDPTPHPEWSNAARAWRDAGASAVGGCCGVEPATIAAMRAALLGGTVTDGRWSPPDSSG